MAGVSIDGGLAPPWSSVLSARCKTAGQIISSLTWIRGFDICGQKIDGQPNTGTVACYNHISRDETSTHNDGVSASAACTKLGFVRGVPQ